MHYHNHNQSVFSISHELDSTRCSSSRLWAGTWGWGRVGPLGETENAVMVPYRMSIMPYDWNIYFCIYVFTLPHFWGNAFKVQPPSPSCLLNWNEHFGIFSLVIFSSHSLMHSSRVFCLSPYILYLHFTFSSFHYLHLRKNSPNSNHLCPLC